LTEHKKVVGASCAAAKQGPRGFVRSDAHCRRRPGSLASTLPRRFALKQIIAIVKPYLAEKVLDALKRSPLEACSVGEVKGYGRQKNYLDQYEGSEYSLAFLPKVEINLWVDDVWEEDILRKIIAVARTGRMGDGKIFVLPSMTSEVSIELSKQATSTGKSSSSPSKRKKERT
jgi:nitrogen regulatory protein PII